MSFTDRLKTKFGDAIIEIKTGVVDPWIEIQPESIVEICAFLKADNEVQFNYLNCITVVDYLHTDEKKAKKVDWDPHLEVVYHISSVTKMHSIVLKVKLPRWKDGVEGQLPEVPSVAGVWRTADWHERETYDLSGVWFSGHPDLRRILCPEDWVGYPLRKDYEMPVDYHGIRNK
ncbi:MAG: NADH-quinone oxidoreductase subunit C [bacterium]|nr:NADH-quinone oxidoreductase subunit C [bacterium]